MEAVRQKSKYKHRKMKSADVQASVNSGDTNDEGKVVLTEENCVLPSCPELVMLPTCENIDTSETNIVSNETSSNLNNEVVFSNGEKFSTDASKYPVIPSLTTECLVSNNILSSPISNVSTNQISELNQTYSDCLKATEVPNDLDQAVSKVKCLYPCLATLESEISVFQSLVKVHKEAYETRVQNLANKEYAELYKIVKNLENHEFYDLVSQYKNERQRLLDAQDEMQSLRSSLKIRDVQLWKEETKEATAKGKCGDGHLVSVTQKYVIRLLDEAVENKICKTLNQLEENLPHLAYQEYQSYYLESKICAYLYSLLYCCGNDSSYEFVNPIFTTLSDVSKREESLKTCISILFHFQRLPTYDTGFILSTRKWLATIAVITLSTGTCSEQMFVLNHILRCPSGIKLWASPLVQFPKNFGDNSSCHFYYALAFLMIIFQPVPGRDDFLKHIKSCPYHSSSCPPECGFLILDAKGEEMETITFENHWTEADILSILKQIPLDRILRISTLYSRDPENSTNNGEPQMQKLIAFSSFLLDILFSGFSTYSLKSFTSVIENISEFICETLTYLSSYWRVFKLKNTLYNFCLQVEVDRVIFHAVYMTLKLKVDSTVLLKTLPYEIASPKMMWNIFWLFHRIDDCDEATMFSVKDVEYKLRDKDMRALLQANLKSMSENELSCILKAMKKMALSSSSEHDFVCCVALEIFEILCTETSALKEHVSLLCSIVHHEPTVVSFFLKNMAQVNEEIFKNSIQLFNAFPLKKWILRNEDLLIITEWLLSSPLSSSQNELARLLLIKVDWGFKKDGNLVLPIKFHRKVALIVLKAYLKNDSLGNKWKVSNSVHQIMQFCSLLPYTADKGFVAWAWKLMFSLKLHVLNHPRPHWIKIFDGSVDSDEFPNLHSDHSLHSLLSAYNEQHPAAYYLAIAMTETGHLMKYLSKEGLDIFAALVKQEQYVAAVQVLYLILPFFVKNKEILTAYETFLPSLAALIIVDQAPFLNGKVSDGTVLCKIKDMIRLQIFEAAKSQIEYANPIIKLWLYLLVKIVLLENKGCIKAASGMNQIFYLLDLIVKISFIHDHTRAGVIELLSAIIRPLIHEPEIKSKSLWSKLVGSNIKYSPLLPHLSSNFSWFSWAVILSEVNQKAIKDLWCDVQNALIIDDSVSVENAFKECSQNACLPSITIYNLPVYWWASQAVEMKLEHPLLPLIWQNFFLCYLQRVPGISGLSKSNQSIGHRLFSCSRFQNLFKNIKLKLKECTDFYHKQMEKFQAELEKMENVPDSSCQARMKVWASKCQANHLFELFQAYSTWINSSKLHETVCLLALEPQYCSEKLKLILDDNPNPWLQYIDLKKIKTQVLPSQDLWNPIPSSDSFNESFIEECVKPTPESEKLPKVEPLKACLPPFDAHSIITPKYVDSVVTKYQDALCDEAIKFEKKLSKFKDLNKKYVTLIPGEFNTKSKEVEVSKPCHNQTKCKEPANFKLHIEKVVRNEAVQLSIGNNRSRFENIFCKMIQPLSESIYTSALHMELTLWKLVEDSNSSLQERSKNAKSVGIRLFYDQIEKLQYMFTAGLGSTHGYTPTKQFFATCIEILGKEFIQDNEDQCLHLVQKLLDNPLACRLASPYFGPNKLSETMLIAVYKALVKALPICDSTNMFVLLSKVKLKIWLSDKQADFSTRRQLLHLIFTGLNHCGSQPTQDKSMVFEIFKKHLANVFLYEFPDLYFETIKLILDASGSRNLSVEIWSEMFHCLCCPVAATESDIDNVISTIGKFASNRMLSPDQKIFVKDCPLNLEQIIHTMDFFHTYFMRIQTTSKNNLYERYKQYVKPIALFLTMMGHSLLEMSLKSFKLPSHERSKTSFLWTLLHKSFQPWIDPWVSTNNLVFPWCSAEEKDAKMILQMFSSCLKFHHLNFEDNTSNESVLSHVLKYYEKTYVQHGIRHYSIAAFHSTFQDLPWSNFHPTIEDIQVMYKVLQGRNSTECRSFLVKICFEMPWLEALNHMLDSAESNEFMPKVLGFVAKIFVIAAWECSDKKKTHLKKLLKELETCSKWEYVTLETIEEIFVIFCQLCEPTKLLLSNSEEKLESHVLIFLKVVTCFIPKEQFSTPVSGCSDGSLEKKRQLYLNQVFTLYTSCTGNESCMENLCLVVPKYMDQIESIVLKDFSPGDQINRALPLVQEVICFVNFIESTKIKPKILQSLVEWLLPKSKSPLLLPSIRCSCCYLTNITTMITVVETCITAIYNTELRDPAEAVEIWNMISSFFQVPMDQHEEFIRACIEHGACFSLYKYIIQRMALVNTDKDATMLFDRVIVWIQNIKPIENCEAKMFLLWDKILEISYELLKKNIIHVVQNGLMKFCSHLSSLAEDDGFFSFLPFSKSTPFSINFRFVCRAIAAYIHMQIPDNGMLRLSPEDGGHMSSLNTQKSEASPSPNARKTLRELQSLLEKKPYSALTSQISRMVKCTSDPQFNFRETRSLFKDLVLQVFPNYCFLHLLYNDV